MIRLYLVLALIVIAGGVRAELQSLFPKPAAATNTVTRAGLFASQPQSEGFFAPLPPRIEAPATGNEVRLAAPPNVHLGTGNAPVDRLLTLIASAEAGPAGYDAVQYGARIKPPLPPTRMTLGDIYRWIDETPGQPHAIGRYQFIPPTLRSVAQRRGFGPETRFTPSVQDSLALVLLDGAGFTEFQAGSLGRRQFMHNLARIWAGLPLPNGRSYYDGHAGNKATMSWATFNGGIARIWPG